MKSLELQEIEQISGGMKIIPPRTWFPEAYETGPMAPFTLAPPGRYFWRP